MRHWSKTLLLLPLLLLACQGGDEGGGEPRYLFHTITPSPVPNSRVGESYSELLTVGGGLAEADQQPLQWSISSGALPPGLALDASGTIQTTLHGTPTVAGTFAFTIRIRSVNGISDASFPQNMVISPSTALVVTTTSLAAGALATPYSQNLGAAGGSAVGYSWSIVAGGLPPGLSLDPKDDALVWGSFAAGGNLDQSLGGGKLSEVSGICASRLNPGALWVHDDIGFGPGLYAVNAQGAVLQEYVLGVNAVDWQDMAIGPGPDPNKEYLYIADVGDNAGTRTDCRLLRVEEPALPATRGIPIQLPLDAFYFTYPGGSQNCATLLVDWESGTPYLVEKTTGAPRVHKFAMPLDTAWTSTSPTTLIQVAATGTFGATLTGGDCSRDGRRMILRGYGAGAEYARPAGGTFDDLFSQAGVPLNVPGSQQHEAVCYSADGAQVFTTTKLAGQAAAPIHVAQAAPDAGYTAITGTPTQSGLYTFTVLVRDSAGGIATRTLAINVP